MKFLTLNKANYYDIYGLVNELIEEDVFSLFSNQNIFYFKDDKREMALVFVSDYGNECYGLSLYYGDDGLNTLHDMLTVKNEVSFGINDYNSINLMLCKGKELMIDEKKLLAKAELKIKRKNNIIPRTYVKGYMSRICNNKEATILCDALVYLIVIIKNDLKQIQEGFKNNSQVITRFANRRRQYKLIIGDLPYLEKPYFMPLSNKEYLSDFKHLKITDDKSYLFLKNLNIPVKISTCNIPISPLLVTYATDKQGVVYLSDITAIPEEYDSYIFSIIYHVFKENGLPHELFINNRKIYFTIKKVMDDLGVILHLQIENGDMDRIMDAIDHASGALFKSNNNSKALSYILESDFKIMFQSVNQISQAGILDIDLEDLGDEFLDDYLEEEEEDYLEELDDKFHDLIS